MKETPRKIVKNTITNAVSFVFLFVSNIFLLPYVVHTIGNELYGGIWAIIGTLTAYIGLLDLGTGTAFVKYISEYHTRGEERNLLEVINTGIVLYGIFGFLILALSFLLGPALLSIAGVSEYLLADALFVFRVGMLVFVIAGVFSPITSILAGIQRMEINASVSVATQAISILGTIFVLSQGFGIRGLIINNLLIVVLNSVGLTYFAFRFVPYLTLHPQYVSLEKGRRFIRYGFNLQVSRLSQIILFQTDRVICLRFFGALSTTYYDLSAKINAAARNFPLMLISALIPAASEMGAKDDRAQLVSLYKRGSKYLIISAELFFLFIIFFAADIMHAWMGREYREAGNFIRVLALGYFFNVVTGVASSITAGVGRTEMDRNVGIFISLFNPVVTIIGAFVYGPIGIALGTALSFVLSSLYFLSMFHSFLDFRMMDFVTLLVKPLPAGVAAALCAAAIDMLSPISGSGRVEGIGLLIFLFVLYSSIYIVLLWITSVFDDYDKDLLKSISSKIIPLAAKN